MSPQPGHRPGAEQLSVLPSETSGKGRRFSDSVMQLRGPLKHRLEGLSELGTVPAPSQCALQGSGHAKTPGLQGQSHHQSSAPSVLSGPTKAVQVGARGNPRNLS